MTALASALTTALIDFAWQGVLVACLLAIALFILRNSSASARYLAGCLALLSMAVIPVVDAWLAFHTTAQSVAAIASSPVMVVSPAEAYGAGRGVPWLFWMQMWLVPAWSIGVILFSCRIVWGCCRLSTVRRRGTAVTEAVRSLVDDLAKRMGITRRVHILMSTMAETPSVAGLLSPVILLPVSSVIGLTPQQLEVILAHELAHLRRYDPLMNALQILIETLLFYHPAVWWASARIRHERELCCDDQALRCCGDRLCFARALEAIEKLRAAPDALAGSVTLGSTGGVLLYRIRRIIGERPRDYSPSKFSGILALVLAIACLTVNVSTRMEAQDRAATTATVHLSPGVDADTAGAEVTESIRYPRSAAEKAIQGTVVVQVDVDDRGNITDARVLNGPPELRKSVLRAVLLWRFKPAATAATRQISVTFQVPPLAELERPEGSGAEFQRSAQEFEERRRPEEQAANLERQLKRLDGKKGGNNDGDSQERRAVLEKLMAGTRGTLEELMRQESMAGRVLAKIEVAGIREDERREQLVKQLPVAIGDTLSRETIEGIRRAIRTFGEQLTFELVPLEQNQAALSISSSNRKTYWATGEGDERVQIDQAIRKLERQLGELNLRHPGVPAVKAQLAELHQRKLELSVPDSEIPSDPVLSDLKAQLLRLDRQITSVLVSSSVRADLSSTKGGLEEMAKLRDMLQGLFDQRLAELAEQQSKQKPVETREPAQQ